VSLDRRDFVKAAAMGSLGAGATSPGEAAAPDAPPPGTADSTGRVDFSGDGIPLSPAGYASLLSRLVAGEWTADEYSRGGPVAVLEEQFARLLGKEAAVFMPTGTLANHLAVRALCGERRRAIVQEVSHLYNDSGDCAQQLSQLNLVPLGPGRASFTPDEVVRLLERTASGRVKSPVGAISIESPVRRLRGETFDLAEMARVSALARERGLGLHLDGARLFVAAAYAGRPLLDYTSLFDTVYVSLWKCFNAAGGAVLAGPRTLLGEMHHVRRMFGGALWNAWPYAVVAGHYAFGYLERLTRAVRGSEELIAALDASSDFEVRRVPNGTSLFFLRPRAGDPAGLRERLARREVDLPPPDGDGFWLKVNETVARKSAAALTSAFRESVRPA
jgi:threonine aldolase